MFCKVLATVLSTWILCSCVLNGMYEKTTYVVNTEKSSETSGTNRAVMSFEVFLQQAEGGYLRGTYILAPGIYQLIKPLQIISPDVRLIGNGEVIFEGGGTGHGLVLGHSNIDISNISFRDIRNCVTVKKQSYVSNISITGITANNVHDCILIDRSIDSTVKNWLISDLKVTNYYRSAVRIAGAGTKRIILSNFSLDGGKSKGYCWKGGIQIYERASHINIFDGRIVNNIGSCGSNYPQGDGIEIDDKDGAPHDISIVNVIVGDSRDGNFDLKGSNIFMKDVISASSGFTKAGFRLWNYDYVCKSCSLEGEFQVPVELNRARLNPQMKDTSHKHGIQSLNVYRNI